ncbi:hypothetical protein SPONN_2741 [uncultured Candidatus Thioglobus sp.]|nr:hypothetical protein SPONL_1859 [uncultured Candidatus Thioglobus sp.]SMN01644.1 hypothetical protein SPONN_2741 [uncultured Candidatus Thioglobus sp.]
MNLLPIKKIILASFAFALMHWKKVAEISILPLLFSLPLLSILPKIFEVIEKVFGTEPSNLQDISIPDNFLLYALLFLYAHLSLSINMYRLVILGEQSVSKLSFFLKPKQVLSFIGLMLLVGLLVGLPLLLTNLIWLYLIAYFLIIPITLNFVNIAIEKPIQYKWNLGFPTQSNLFFLQVLFPMLIGVVASLIISSIGLPSTVDWFIKIVVFYWSLVNLALCYQLISKSKA